MKLEKKATMIKTGIARTEDVKQLARLLGELLGQEKEFTVDLRRQSRGIRRILADPGKGVIVIARHQGKVVGMINLLFTVSTAEGGPACILEDCVVASGHRCRGIGSRLMRYAIRFARSRRMRRITLLTDCSNTGAQRFYQRHGFVKSTMLPMRLRLDDINVAGRC